MAKTHADGTTCLEGTRFVPERWTPCCETFEGHVDTCAHDIRYEFRSKTKRWVIAIAESAGGGGIEIGWCPHCGASLKPSAN